MSGQRFNLDEAGFESSVYKLEMCGQGTKGLVECRGDEKAE